MKLFFIITLLLVKAYHAIINCFCLLGECYCLTSSVLKVKLGCNENFLNSSFSWSGNLLCIFATTGYKENSVILLFFRLYMEVSVLPAEVVRIKDTQIF